MTIFDLKNDNLILHMFSNFVIVHRQHLIDGDDDPLFKASAEAVWQTCIRQIYFFEKSRFQPQYLRPHDHVLYAENAYSFLLEVISGLHSPIIGETEVHGQFKDFIASVEASADKKISKNFLMLLSELNKHAKLMRREYLKGLGSQSYGTYCRKKIRSYNQVNVLGTGHLAQEILPWLKKINALVRIHCRSWGPKTEIILKKYPQYSLESLDSPLTSLSGALIIAAPMSSFDILRWLEKQPPHSLSYILDLRGESKTDPLCDLKEVSIDNLETVFKSIEQSRDKVQKELLAAKKAIVRLTLELKELYEDNSNWGSQKRSRPAAGLSRRSAATKTSSTASH